MKHETFERLVHDAPFHDAGYGFDVFGLHPPSLAQAVELARPLYERYFRVDSVGADRIPAYGPTILIANHGGVLPVDAAVLCLDVLLRSQPPRIPRAVTDQFVPRLPLVSTLFARLGVVSGTRPNVRALLERGELLALWPEGVAGVSKPFTERYRLQKWSVGFAELAIRHGATILPVAIIGSEESWPLVARIPMRLFGAPYLPIPAFPLPLPVHYHLRYGAPLRFDHAPEEADDPAVVEASAGEARVALERLITDTRMVRRGVFR